MRLSMSVFCAEMYTLTLLFNCEQIIWECGIVKVIKYMYEALTELKEMRDKISAKVGKSRTCVTLQAV